jgi:glutathione synthase/RimK-type ligase-like ATP-grasp enzyme
MTGPGIPVWTMPRLIVTDNPSNWEFGQGVEVVAAQDFLTHPRFVSLRRTRVFNLCRSYAYQSVGYYVSLLAEARGQKPIPSVTTIEDLRMAPVVRVVSEELEDLIARALGEIAPPTFVLEVYFGRSVESRYGRLARALYNYFPSPLLRARFRKGDAWELERVRPIALSEIPPEDRSFVESEARRYFAGPHEAPKADPAFRYDLAILVSKDETDAPSDTVALGKFVRAAARVGIEAMLIEKEDYGRIAEFDALFIRETTRVNHHTYRFSRRAESEGLVVVDSPASILRCTNKVYLAELLTRHGVPIPKTLVVGEGTDPDRIVTELGFPCVLKRPDSAFSAGVVKASGPEELSRHLDAFFKESGLIVAQEFVPSSFDWRVGVLERRPLYACRYHMVEGHWQIQKSGRAGWRRYGKAESVPVETVPPGVLEAGLASASLIGDGLYGVDVKEVDGRVMVMEVNDNPSIEAGIEDGGNDAIYDAVMRYFLDRLEERGRKGEPAERA